MYLVTPYLIGINATPNGLASAKPCDKATAVVPISTLWAAVTLLPCWVAHAATIIAAMPISIQRTVIPIAAEQGTMTR